MEEKNTLLYDLIWECVKTLETTGELQLGGGWGILKGDKMPFPTFMFKGVEKRVDPGLYYRTLNGGPWALGYFSITEAVKASLHFVAETL
jgi:hypothetical protein